MQQMTTTKYIADCSHAEGTDTFGPFETWNEARDMAVEWKNLTSGYRVVIIRRYDNGVMATKKIYTFETQDA
jgi:hypothetical protein